MTRTKEDLADFVRRVRAEKGLSTRDVAKNSGGKISYGYVNQIENRTVLGLGVSPSRLVALATGLEVPEAEVFAVASGTPLTEVKALEKRLLALFSQLPPERQEDAIRIIRSLRRAPT